MGNGNDFTLDQQQKMDEPPPMEAPPPQPELPDGIGMDMEQVRKLLAEKNRMIVKPDDPVLMLVTMLNVFLAEEEKLLNRHNKALTAVLSKKSEEYVKNVEAITQSLGATLSSSALDAMNKVFADHRVVLEKHRANMLWLTVIVGFSAFVNVAVFILNNFSIIPR